MRKGEFSKSIVTKELWRAFKKEHPEHKKMSWDEFYEYWNDMAQIIREEVISNPLGVKLGCYTGELKLQFLPYNYKAKNNSLTAELGEEVNHVNLITKGKVARIKWERRWAVKFNKILQFFAFEPTRELNKMAVKYIDDHPEKPRVARNTFVGKSAWRQIGRQVREGKIKLK